MTRHLVSKLDKKAQLLLRDELVARLRLAEAAYGEYVSKAKLNDELCKATLGRIQEAALAGFGFTVEEARTAVMTERALKDRQG